MSVSICKAIERGETLNRKMLVRAGYRPHRRTHIQVR